MIKLKQIAVAAMMVAGSVGVANADVVTSISITGGDFAMGAPGTGACGAGGPFGPFQCITAGTVNPINTNDGLFEGPALLGLNFFAQPVTTFTALTAAGAAGSTSGMPIHGNTSITGIDLDLGSFYAFWNGSNFLQAPSTSAGPISPTVHGSWLSTGPNAGTFDVSWSSYITTAPFAGQTGFWHITGSATTAPAAVPVPAAAWLLGSGLVGLVGVARRRKAVA